MASVVVEISGKSSFEPSKILKPEAVEIITKVVPSNYETPFTSFPIETGAFLNSYQE